MFFTGVRETVKETVKETAKDNSKQFLTRLLLPSVSDDRRYDCTATIEGQDFNPYL